jgi:hypothetical protein
VRPAFPTPSFGAEDKSNASGASRREDEVVSETYQRHMWTAPIGKLFFDVTNDLVSFSHMSGLLVRHDGRWP